MVVVGMSFAGVATYGEGSERVTVLDNDEGHSAHWFVKGSDGDISFLSFEQDEASRYKVISIVDENGNSHEFETRFRQSNKQMPKYTFSDEDNDTLVNILTSNSIVKVVTETGTYVIDYSSSASNQVAMLM